MTIIRSPIKERVNRLQNFKRPKMDAIREFPNGCGRRVNFPPNSKQSKVVAIREFPDGRGALASVMHMSEHEEEEGDDAKHIDHTTSHVKKMEVLSVPRFKSLNTTTNIVQKCFGANMEKGSSPNQDIPGHHMLVSSSFRINDTNNLKLGREDKQVSGACMSLSTPKPIKDGQLEEHNFSFVFKEPKDCHEKVKKAVVLYRKILTKIFQESKGKSKMQSNPSISAYLRAVRFLFEEVEWVRVPKQLGPIRGVEVGDKFQSRAELKVVGLHNHLFSGIDYITKNGEILATSVVASGRYENDMISSSTLIYSGQGGNPLTGSKQLVDQKLERGNLALMNSKNVGAVVRVIRGFQTSKAFSHIGPSGKKLCKVYVYDGLYIVDDYWQQRGQFGKLVFKFLLKRISGQSKLDYGEFVSKRKYSRTRKNERVKDVFQGKENVPIQLRNSIDEQKKLPSFNNITKASIPFNVCKDS